MLDLVNRMREPISAYARVTAGRITCRAISAVALLAPASVMPEVGRTRSVTANRYISPKATKKPGIATPENATMVRRLSAHEYGFSDERTPSPIPRAKEMVK